MMDPKRWELCRHDILRRNCLECRAAPVGTTAPGTDVTTPTGETRTVRLIPTPAKIGEPEYVSATLPGAADPIDPITDALLDAEACIVAFARRLGHTEAEVHALASVRAALKGRRS